MVDVGIALMMVKARLNRMGNDAALDEYLETRIAAADLELRREGVITRGDDPADVLLVVDSAVEQYLNRDKAGNGSAMPEWLRARRNERWLNNNLDESTEGAT